jgi:Holliday junction resolvase
MTPESKVKKKVTTILDQLGAYYFYPVTGGYGRSGVPDIVCCLNGNFIGIECKAGDNKPTALQNKNLEEIQAAGGFAFVVNEDNIDSLERVLKVMTRE